MNIILGVAVAYLDFIPNAGSSLSSMLFSIILYLTLCGIGIGLRLKQKIKR